MNPVGEDETVCELVNPDSASVFVASVLVGLVLVRLVFVAPTNWLVKRLSPNPLVDVTEESVFVGVEKKV